MGKGELESFRLNLLKMRQAWRCFSKNAIVESGSGSVIKIYAKKSN